MKLLITGANGFLGQHLCRVFKEQYHVVATGRGERRIPFDEVTYHNMDIADASNVKEVIAAVAPQIIIHTAAMSKPDECLNDTASCDAINVGGTRALIMAAKLTGQNPHFIFTSTDFVFGEGGPHSEDAIPDPLNYYGDSKLKAEKIVEASGLPYSIVRPVFMYGETWEGMRPTFLHWIKNSIEAGRSVKVVNDQHRTPSYVGDICKGIASLIEKSAYGLFHLAGPERITPYQMAVILAKQIGADISMTEPVTADVFNEPVRRAKEGGLIIDKAKLQLGFNPVDFITGLKLSGFPSGTAQY